jgi:hypothetical protein
MSTYNGTWIPTPYVIISMGMGKNAINTLTFTTLTHLNKRKYVSDVNITQTSKTTVEYTVNLKYYPDTFSKGDPNFLETALNLAIRNESTRNIYITFGYQSNSPYTGKGESSHTYKGLITNMTSQVNENYITYTIKGYGCDVLLGYFFNIDKTIVKYIKMDTICQNFIKETLLHNGEITIDSQNYKFDIQFENVDLNKSFGSLILNEGYWNNLADKLKDEQQGKASVSPEQIVGVAELNRLGNMTRYQPTLDVNQVIQDNKTYIINNVEKIKEKQWNKFKESINFDNLTNTYIDSENITNQTSADTSGITEKNQFSVYEAIEIINRLLNMNLAGKKYNIKCTIEPYSNNSNYDGVIKIFDAGTPLTSKKVFYYGIWSQNKGFLSNKNPVVSWDCDYNATAKLFSGKRLSVSSKAGYDNIESTYKDLAKTLNTEVELSLNDLGELQYNLTSSQTKSVGTTDYRVDVNQTTQYATVLDIIKNLLDYPYSATITVLGIADPPVEIARDTIDVYVYVNGTEHFTSGTYLITGCNHTINNSGFHTTYNLIKIPKNSTTKQINDLMESAINSDTLEKRMTIFNTSEDTSGG